MRIGKKRRTFTQRSQLTYGYDAPGCYNIEVLIITTAIDAVSWTTFVSIEKSSYGILLVVLIK